MSADNDLWYVKTADGDVDRMTLDELDEAFNDGRIDENVVVLPAGDTKWVKLGALLGLDQPAAPAQTAKPVAFGGFAPIPNSMRPVSIDLSDDVDAPFRKKSRKGLFLGAVVGALAIGGIAFAASRGGIIDASKATATIAAPPPVTAAPPPPPTPTPDPPATTAAPLPDTRFTDEQKAKLAAADKVRDEKAKSHKKSRATGGGTPHSSAKYKSQGFTSGGNKFDPLNANL
jgi:hypothetical protein